MIIPNGTVILLSVPMVVRDRSTGMTSGGSAIAIGEIPCQYVQKRRNDLDRSNGERVTTASYDIYLEEQELPSFSSVRLIDSKGTLLGEFSPVCPTEYLSAVGQIKLQV